MNSLGLSLIIKMGCLCSKETVFVNASKYFILDKLGEGGFSTVHLVENSHTKKRYALKKIICHSIEDHKTALQEIEYTNAINHDNVIKIIDSSFKGNADIVLNTISEIYIVLPYFRRGTLHNYLELCSSSRNYLKENDILNMFLQISEGVRAFHNLKPEPLAHRDLKTANICLSDDLQPIIMDLGSTMEARIKIKNSHEAQRIQDLAAERCSMPYRAPELFNVESYCLIDERTDIWSLGCILYAMCYFKSPFDTVYERGDSVALAVLSGNVHFPEDGPYSEDMHNLIKFILNVNPFERPYIDTIIMKTQELIAKIDMCV